MLKRIILPTLLVMFLSSIIAVPHGAGTSTTVKIDPQSTTGLLPGDAFSINITVSDVIDMYSWETELYYNSQVINGTSIIEGDFLKAGGINTFFLVVDFRDNYNDTTGFIYLGATRIGNVTGVDGNGTLATISFKAIAEGNSPLHFHDTKLRDSTKPFGQLIPHTAIDGSAYVGQVNVAINDITTPINIPKGTVAYINVTTQNKGIFTATFDVTLYDEGDPIETKSVINLPGGGIQILGFTWDTTPTLIGEYTLRATATQIPGEQDLSDNNLTTKVYVGTRDLAITNINPYKTSIPLETPKVDVQVTVQNKGQATETFNVTLYYNSTLIGNQTIALISGASQNLTFTWNTTILFYGKYALQAYAAPLPYETQTTDNNLTAHAVVTIPGDINGDGTVDIYDAILLSGAYNSNPFDPLWNPNADINGDNNVDIYDAILLAGHYQEHI